MANNYFEADNRSVAIYNRAPSEEPEDPRLAALDDQERQTIQMVQQQLAGATSAQLDLLRQQLAQMEAQQSQVPPENQDMIAVMLDLVRARIAELEEEGQ